MNIDQWRDFLSYEGIKDGMPFVIYPQELSQLIEDNETLRARVADLETANALLRHDCAKAEIDIAERDLVIDTLEAQIVAHERVCAGVWVPVGERLPEILLRVPAITHDGEMQWMEVGLRGEWLGLDEGEMVTHWLDAKLPTSSGEEKEQ